MPGIHSIVVHPDDPDHLYVAVSSAGVIEVIDALEQQHPGFASFVMDERGRLRRHVNVFVGQEPVADREALSDPIRDEQEMYVLQALSGG